jgi:protein-disulfide isomerase
VPVAIFGVIWFAGVLLLLLAGSVGPQVLRENVPGYLFALSTAGLAVVLYLGYISIAVLKAYCVLCLTTDAAVVGLFLVSGAATSFPMTTLPRRAVTDVRAWISSPIAVAVTLLFFGGAASAVAFFPREDAAQQRVPIIVPSDGAKVLIVDFSDFQCPYCRQAFVSLKPIIAKYNAQQPNTVRLVLKDYPLDSECNINVQNGGPHPSACEAAVAVRLARGHNREDAMEEWLFANQEGMTPDTVKKAAREVGQVADFDAKYTSLLELVKGDVAFGKSLGVQATPTLFINGVRIAGVLAPQYLDQAIALELQRAAK